MTMLDDPPEAGTGGPAPRDEAPVPATAEATLLPPLPTGSPARTGKAGALVAVLVAGLGLVLLLTAVVVLTMGGGGEEERAGGSYGVVIPAGTGKRIASGFHLYLIPTDLQLHVGDSLVVVNQDTQVHEVGPFFVRPGETMKQTFTEPGRFVGACTFHPAGEVAIEVFEPDVPISPPSLPYSPYR